MNDKRKFLSCAQEAGIILENNSITKITDYRKVHNFLEKLNREHIMLGMDMPNGTCSGSVQISAIEENHICMYETDNQRKDYFKFKGLIILNTESDDEDWSPEMFFESDDDDDWLANYQDNAYPYPYPNQQDTFLGLEVEGIIIYDKREIERYMDLENESYYDSSVQVPAMVRVIRNTTKGMIAYINVQQCRRRHQGNVIVSRAARMNCDQLLSGFSKSHKII